MDDTHEIRDGDTRWTFDVDFLNSRWECIWGRGCQGILDEPAEHLAQGCCSVGAEMSDADEAMQLSAMAALLDAEAMQYSALAQEVGIFSDDTRTNTRVVDGACIFLNRPGFAAGTGCALHLAAVAHGEPVTEWKPSVCWQLPIRVDWVERADGSESAHLRRWSRADWGPEGTTMAWCCTEESASYQGNASVVDSLAVELEAVVGTTVFVELRRRLSSGD